MRAHRAQRHTPIRTVHPLASANGAQTVNQPCMHDSKVWHARAGIAASQREIRELLETACAMCVIVRAQARFVQQVSLGTIQPKSHSIANGTTVVLGLLFFGNRVVGLARLHQQIASNAMLRHASYCMRACTHFAVETNQPLDATCHGGRFSTCAWRKENSNSHAILLHALAWPNQSHPHNN